MLLDQIRQDSLTARKARDTVKATFLVTLLAEAAKVGKDDGNRVSTDAEVVAVVKKFIKNTEETLRAIGNQPQARQLPEAELSILQHYLPRQASTEEVRTALQQFVQELEQRNLKQLGGLMAKLTVQFGGNFDKSQASMLAKEMLTS